MIKHALFAIAAATMATPAFAGDEAATHTEDAKHASRTAVTIYADWCPSCKVLEPKLKEVKADASVEGVKFVKLDYSARDKADFWAQAEAAGVKSAVETALKGKIKTGVVIVVDAQTGEAIKKLGSKTSVEDIVANLAPSA